MDRRLVLALVAVVAVLSAVVGWAGGTRIKSPAEVAAEQKAPTASLITVPVEFRTLSQDVIARGTVSPSDETELEVSSTVGSALITRAPKDTGDLIDEGDVIIEVAGRPVIALQGELPAFRNLIPGLQGPELRQLEEALVRLGYDPGPVDDVYSTATADAVAEMYRDRGYSPPEADEGDRAAVDGAESAVDGAEQTVKDAEEALADAQKPLSAADRTDLDLSVSQAEIDLEAAKATASETKAEAARLVKELEGTRAERVTNAESAASRLQQARDGTHPDTGQPPSPAELTELEAADSEAKNAVAEVDAELASAKGAQTRTTTAEDLAIRTAENGVIRAKSNRTDALSPPDLARLRTNVTEAKTDLTEARADLTDAKTLVGAWLPESEVVFLSSVPRQVGTVFAEVGEIPAGPVMTISGAETIIESGIPAASRRLIEVGDEALLEDDNLGISIKALVTFVADTPGGAGLSEERYAMRLEPVDEVPEDAINVSLRVIIPIESSGGDVLAVPLAALSAGPDGTARVEVEREVGETVLVEVTAGLRAEGFVQVEPIEASLEAGDRVVVGRDLELPGSVTSTDSGSDSGGDSDGNSGSGSDSGGDSESEDEEPDS